MPSDATLYPVTEQSLVHYFARRIERQARRFQPPPGGETCLYLASVLDRFGRSERLFAWEQGQLGLRPLALLYGDAMEAPTERERCLLLQQLGDMALFLGALFPERYARHGIRQDYFVGMGGGAYGYLADRAPRNRQVFGELAGAFGRMMEAVAGACARTREPSAQDVLGLYRRWLTTRDPALGQRLMRMGVTLPVDQRLN